MGTNSSTTVRLRTDPLLRPWWPRGSYIQTLQVWPARSSRSTSVKIVLCPRQPARPVRRAHPLLVHPASVAHQLARGLLRLQRLHVPGGLPQPAVLVEVAPGELERPVVVRMPNGRGGVEHLHPPG